MSPLRVPDHFLSYRAPRILSPPFPPPQTLGLRERDESPPQPPQDPRLYVVAVILLPLFFFTVGWGLNFFLSWGGGAFFASANTEKTLSV